MLVLAMQFSRGCVETAGGTGGDVTAMRSPGTEPKLEAQGALIARSRRVPKYSLKTEQRTTT